MKQAAYETVGQRVIEETCSSQKKRVFILYIGNWRALALHKLLAAIGLILPIGQLLPSHLCCHLPFRVKSKPALLNSSMDSKPNCGPNCNPIPPNYMHNRLNWKGHFEQIMRSSMIDAQVEATMWMVCLSTSQTQREHHVPCWGEMQPLIHKSSMHANEELFTRIKMPK